MGTGAEDFQRDGATEARVRRAVDLRHSARAERIPDLIATQTCARAEIGLRGHDCIVLAHGLRLAVARRPRHAALRTRSKADYTAQLERSERFIASTSAHV